MGIGLPNSPNSQSRITFLPPLSLLLRLLTSAHSPSFLFSIGDPKMKTSPCWTLPSAVAAVRSLRDLPPSPPARDSHRVSLLLFWRCSSLRRLPLSLSHRRRLCLLYRIHLQFSFDGIGVAAYASHRPCCSPPSLSAKEKRSQLPLLLRCVRQLGVALHSLGPSLVLLSLLCHQRRCVRRDIVASSRRQAALRLVPLSHGHSQI